MTEPKKRGRKTISKDGEPMKNRAIRATEADWQKFLLLGGAAWLRKAIRRAKPPQS